MKLDKFQAILDKFIIDATQELRLEPQLKPTLQWETSSIKPESISHESTFAKKLSQELKH